MHRAHKRMNAPQVSDMASPTQMALQTRDRLYTLMWLTCALAVLVVGAYAAVAVLGATARPGLDGVNGTDCNCSGAIQTVNDIGPDSQANFELLPGTNVQIVQQGNGLLISATGGGGNGTDCNCSSAIQTVNHIEPDADANFELLPGTNVQIVQQGNGLLISATGGNGSCECNLSGVVRTVNGEAPDGTGDLLILAGAGISVTQSPSAVTINNTLLQGITTINNASRDAQNGFAITSSSPELDVITTAHGVDFLLTLLQGIVTINNVTRDALDGFAITSSSPELQIAATAHGLDFLLTLLQGIVTINNVTRDAQNGFAITSSSPELEVFATAHGLDFFLTLLQGIVTINNVTRDAQNGFAITSSSPALQVSATTHGIDFLLTLLQGIVTINNVTRDAQNGFAITSSSPSALAITATAHGLDFSVTITQGIETINNVTRDVQNGFAITSASPELVISSTTHGLSFLLTLLQGITTINNVTRDAQNGFAITSSSPNLLVNATPHGLDLILTLLQGIVTINNVTRDAQNGFAITSSSPELQVSTTTHGLDFLLTLLQGIVTINNVTRDAQNGFAITSSSPDLLVNATPHGLDLILGLVQGLLSINNISIDAQYGFALVPGANVTLTPLAHGLQIDVNALPGPQGPQGNPGANGTCGCNGTLGIYTINGENPDGDLNFAILPGAGISVVTGTSQVTIASTILQGIRTINNVTRDVQDGFALTSTSATLIWTSTTHGLALSTTLLQGIVTINNVTRDAQNGFAITSSNPALLVNATPHGLDLVLTLTRGIDYINGVPPNANHSFTVLVGDGLTIESLYTSNAIRINATAAPAAGLLTINDVAANASRNFALQGVDHVIITAITNGLDVGTDATPYNNASTIVARDASGDFAARHITAELFRAVGVSVGNPYESLVTVLQANNTFPGLTLTSGGHMFWGNETLQDYDTFLFHVAEETLQLQNNLILYSGWLTLIPVPLIAPGTAYVPLNSEPGDLSAVRLLVGESVALGSGADGPFVRMGATMTASNASAVVGPYGACGAVLLYRVAVDPFAGVSDGTFSGTALTLEFSSWGTVHSEMVATRSTLMIDDVGGATTMVGLDARNRVNSSTPCITCAAHIILVSPYGDGGSAYAVGDVVSLTGCSGSGATVVVTSVASQFPFPNYVTGFTVLTRGTGYVSGAGCTTTAVNGTGAGMVVLIVAGNSTYDSLIGLRATAYSVDAGLAPVARLGEAVGIEVGTSNLGSATVSATLVNNLQSQYGVRVLNQALGTVLNAGVWLQQMTGNATTNYGYYLEGIAGNTTNYGMWVGAITGAGTNVGVRIEAPQAGTLGVALQLQAGQSTTSAGGILWGSGADSPKANLYRSAASRLTTDGSLTISLDLQARAITAQEFLALPANSTEVSILTRLSGDVTNRWQTTGGGVFNWADGTNAADTNLYRASAGRLQTDTALTVGLGVTTQQLLALPANSTEVSILTRLSGDATNRWQTTGDGVLSWGNGTGAVDTNLYRLSTARLQTDGSLTVAVDARVGTYMGVGSTSTPTNTVAGDLTATRAMVGTPQQTLSETTASTMMVIGAVTNSTPAGSSCGFNSTIQVTATGVTSGTFFGNSMTTDMTSDAAGVGAINGLVTGNRFFRAGGITTVTGARIQNVVTTNVPSTNGLLAVAVTAGGTGYTVGNQLTVTGGGGTGGTVLVATVSSGVVLTVTMERPGTGYSVGTGRATTGGSGSGCTINIQSVGTTTYTNMRGLVVVPYDATGTFATPSITSAITGVLIAAPNFGSASALPAGPPTHYALQINAVTKGTSANRAITVDDGGGANGATNYGLSLGTMSGASGANVGINIGAMSGTNSTNIGIDIAPPTGGGTSSNIGLRIQQPSGGSGVNVALQLSTQTTDGRAGILFGSGADSTLVNLYRSGAGKLRTDGEFQAQHLISGTSTPTVAVGAAAGSGATASISGKDTSFLLTLNTGTGTTAFGTLLTVTYGAAFTSGAAYPVFCPANGAAASLATATQQVYLNGGALSTGSFSMSSNAAAVTASSTFIWTVHVIGAQ